jgi:predicted RNase H-like nuclease
VLVQVLGVDACRGKWLGIAIDDGDFVGARLSPRVEELLACWPDVVAVGMDIPIGLPDEPLRDADRAAREFVGERRSSVFPTFPQAALVAPTYEEAKRVAEENGWPKPSIQSYGMRHRILEIDQLAREDERVLEVHPEVSFRELVGRPLSPKRTAAGISERHAALAQAGVVLPDLPYPVEDALDAAVAAWTALRYARGEAKPLPERRTRIGAIWR